MIYLIVLPDYQISSIFPTLHTAVELLWEFETQERRYKKRKRDRGDGKQVKKKAKERSLGN